LDTILIIQEDPLSRNRLMQTLVDSYYLVLEARNIAEAVSIAREYDGKIDLLILENKPRNGDLSEIVTRTTGFHPEIRFLMIADLPAGEDVLKTQPARHRYEILEKPWVAPALIDRVRRVLARSGSDVA
jgi:DNA-binding NtrC family response regulator